MKKYFRIVSWIGTHPRKRLATIAKKPIAAAHASEHLTRTITRTSSPLAAGIHADLTLRK